MFTTPKPVGTSVRSVLSRKRLLRGSAYLITALAMAIGVMLIRNTFFEPSRNSGTTNRK